MTFVVTDNCIKCKYMDCVEVCPVDCFYEGENMLVIRPTNALTAAFVSRNAPRRRSCLTQPPASNVGSRSMRTLRRSGQTSMLGATHLPMPRSTTNLRKIRPPLFAEPWEGRLMDQPQILPNYNYETLARWRPVEAHHDCVNRIRVELTAAARRGSLRRGGDNENAVSRKRIAREQPLRADATALPWTLLSPFPSTANR